VQRSGGDLDLTLVVPILLEHAIEMEGHADNVAASLHGGLVATAAGRAVRIPLGLAPAVVVWVPQLETSTTRSRHALPSTVSFEDAVFNVGRTALLIAALATGDVAALHWATADRLHQDRRLAAVPESRDALSCGLDAGAWCGWLSGSGPAVAFLCEPEAASSLAEALPPAGHAKLLGVADRGVQVVPDPS
jgi:homoserine kinase